MRPWIANVSEAAARTWPVEAGTVCISITEPGSHAPLPPLRGFDDVLRLEFSDFDLLRPGHVGPSGARRVTARDAQQLAEFANQHRGKNILVHCAAGISRSGAIVETLLAAFPEYEDRGWSRYPNRHVSACLRRAMGLGPVAVEA
jgi:predicted protein tyrosine phosphatase